MRDLPVTTSFPLVDEILGTHAAALGADAAGYRNHVVRVLNFFRALGGEEQVPEPVIVAAAFHDLGIWTANTLDYIPPSIRLAEDFLQARALTHLQPQVHRLIEHHHKLRAYRHDFAQSVERYRQADLVDLSLGLVRFAVDRPFIRRVRARLPDEGFHARLVKLALRQLLKTPWRPLPMLRW